MESVEQDKCPTRFPVKASIKESEDEAIFQVSDIGEGMALSAQSTIPKLDDLVENAQILIRGRDFDLAKNLVGRSLQFYPRNLKLLNLLAEVSVILRDWQMVEKSYRALVDIDDSEENVLKLCETLQRTGRFSEARKQYSDLLARTNVSEENLFQVYKDLGNLCIREDDLDSAEEFYNKAFAIDHYSDTLLVNFGTLELKKGCTEVALERFRDALEVNSENSQAWVGLALIHRQYGDFELSYANVSSALDHDPYNVSALKLFSDWSAATGRSQAAIQRLVEYLEIHDQDDEVLLVLAKMYFVSGQIPLAVLEAEKAFSLNPDNRDAFNFLKVAMDYVQKGECS